MVVGLFGDDDMVDQNAGNLDLAWVERTALGNAFDLDDHRPAGIMRSHGNRHRLQRQRFLLHGHVAVRIGGGAADDADIDRERTVEKVFLAIDLFEFDEVALGDLVDLAAAEARIHECPEANASQ